MALKEQTLRAVPAELVNVASLQTTVGGGEPARKRAQQGDQGASCEDIIAGQRHGWCPRERTALPIAR